MLKTQLNHLDLIGSFAAGKPKARLVSITTLYLTLAPFPEFHIYQFLNIARLVR